MSDSVTDSTDIPLPPGTGRLALLALVVGCATLAVLLYPFNFQSPRQGPWLGLVRPDALGLLCCALLFVPLGVVESWVAHKLFGHDGAAVVVTVIDCALLGLIAESAQLWSPSHNSSLIDLVAYSIGATVGAMLACTVAPRLSAGRDS